MFSAQISSKIKGVRLTGFNPDLVNNFDVEVETFQAQMLDMMIVDE